MFIAQIIELRGLSPHCRTCNPKTGYFQDKTKISNENKSSSELLLTFKFIAKGNVPCYPSPGLRHLQNLKRKFKQREN